MPEATLSLFGTISERNLASLKSRLEEPDAFKSSVHPEPGTERAGWWRYDMPEGSRLPSILDRIARDYGLSYTLKTGDYLKMYDADLKRYAAYGVYDGTIHIPLYDIDDAGIVDEARRWQAWLDTDAVLTVTPSPAPDAPARSEESALDAMVLWEAVLEALRRAYSGEARRMDFALQEHVANVGYCALRGQVLGLQPTVTKAWEEYENAGAHDLLSFDWEFVPWFIDACTVVLGDVLKARGDWYSLVKERAKDDLSHDNLRKASAEAEDGD